MNAIIFVLLLSPVLSWAKKPIRAWETAQSKSLANAGLANLSMVNGLYNNASMLSFFTNSLAYLQINSSKLANSDSATRIANYGNDVPPKGFTVGITDSSNLNKGGVSYQDYKESGIERKRYSFAMAFQSDRDMSFGVQYNYTTDAYKNLSTGPEIEDKFHQGNFSFTYMLSSKWNLSIIYFDPFQSSGIETRSMVANQISIIDRVILFVDAGWEPTSSFQETLVFNWAAEINIYQGFYIRYGRFLDKIINQQGSGMGFGWNGERFSLEFALKNSERRTDQGSFLLAGEDLKETTFSLTYLF